MGLPLRDAECWFQLSRSLNVKVVGKLSADREELKDHVEICKAIAGSLRVSINHLFSAVLPSVLVPAISGDAASFTILPYVLPLR